MLENFMKSLQKTESQDALTLSQTLNSGKAVVTAINMSTPIKFGFIKIPHNTIGIQYLYRVEGNKLYCYKMNLSTKEKLVLSLCAVFPMAPDLFTGLYTDYIATKEVMYTCDEELLENAELRACIPNSKETVPLGLKEKHLIENQFNANPRTALFLETM